MERKRSIRRRQKPRFAERAKEHCRKFTAFMFSNVGIILLVILYTIAGSFMFQAIEGNEATKRWENADHDRKAALRNLWEISCCKSNVYDKTEFVELIEQEVKLYQKTIVKAARGGYSGKPETGGGAKGDAVPQWSLSGSFLYSLTVITTIGYGNLVPRNPYGKLATILYAIIGMPLFLLYLSNIGDILAKSFKWIYAKLCLCRVCPGVAKRRALRQRRKMRALAANQDLSSLESFDDNNFNDDDDDETDSITDEYSGVSSEEIQESNTDKVIVPLTICVMIMIGYMFFGAILFGSWEEWPLLNGSYFCFISLSSIGFGDIVPGAQTTGNKESFEDVGFPFILCAIYLLLGMALIAMCFNLMQEQVIHKIRAFKRCIRVCLKCNSCRNR